MRISHLASLLYSADSHISRWMESAYHVFDADNKQVGFAKLADPQSS